MCQTYKAVEIIRSCVNGSKLVIVEVPCQRCSGNGVFQHLKNIDGGRCYKCGGTGVEEKKVIAKGKDEVVLVNRTTEIKKVKPVNDNAALKNAMIRINNEHKERRAAIKRQQLEDQKLFEEMNNCTDRFTWDD